MVGKVRGPRIWESKKVPRNSKELKYRETIGPIIIIDDKMYLEKIRPRKIQYYCQAIYLVIPIPFFFIQI